MKGEPLQRRHSLCKRAVRLNRDVCGLQHRGELLLKRMRGVVGGLIGDVLLDPIELRWADAERAVAFLPGQTGDLFLAPIGWSSPSRFVPRLTTQDPAGGLRVCGHGFLYRPRPAPACRDCARSPQGSST